MINKLFLDNYVKLPQIGPTTQAQHLNLCHDLTVLEPSQTVVVQKSVNMSDPSNIQYENINTRFQQQSRDLQYKAGPPVRSIKQGDMEMEIVDACILNNKGTMHLHRSTLLFELHYDYCHNLCSDLVISSI